MTTQAFAAARLVFTAHSIPVAMAGAVSRAAPGVVVVGGRPARNTRRGAFEAKLLMPQERTRSARSARRAGFDPMP